MTSTITPIIIPDLIIKLLNVIETTKLYKENENMVKNIIKDVAIECKKLNPININYKIGSKFILGVVNNTSPLLEYSKLYILMCINNNRLHNIYKYNLRYNYFFEDNKLIMLLLKNINNVNDIYGITLRQIYVFISNINVEQHKEQITLQKKRVDDAVALLNISEESKESYEPYFNIMKSEISLYGELSANCYAIINHLNGKIVSNHTNKQLYINIMHGFFFYENPSYRFAKLYLIICTHKKLMYDIDMFINMCSTYFNNLLFGLILDNIVNFNDNSRILLCNIFDCLDTILYVNNNISPSIIEISPIQELVAEVKEQNDDIEISLIQDSNIDVNDIDNQQDVDAFNTYLSKTDFDNIFLNIFNTHFNANNTYNPVVTYGDEYINNLMKADFMFDDDIYIGFN